MMNSMSLQNHPFWSVFYRKTHDFRSVKKQGARMSTPFQFSEKSKENYFLK